VPLFLKVRSFLRNLFFSRRVEVDLDKEVHSHLEMLIEENMRAGLPPKEAQRAARIELGGIEQVKEQIREERIGNWLHSVESDCRYGVRQLRKNPGFTAVAVLTLALGIGATTAIFSVIDATLLRGLPYRDPSQLVEIGENNPQGEADSVSAADLTELQNTVHSFEKLGYAGDWKFYTMTGVGEPDEAWGWQVSANLFQVLGVNAALGRTFVPAEKQSVILSAHYWRTHFSANPDVIGRTLALDGNSFLIVGVMPPDFYFRTPATDLWVPLLLTPKDASASDQRSLSARN
jgi:putative ABC transport system permease protein